MPSKAEEEAQAPPEGSNLLGPTARDSTDPPLPQLPLPGLGHRATGRVSSRRPDSTGNPGLPQIKKKPTTKQKPVSRKLR